MLSPRDASCDAERSRMDQEVYTLRHIIIKK